MKDHWRKTAKTCPGCNKVTSIRKFLEGMEKCASCSFDDIAFAMYRLCPYCKRFFKREDPDRKLCCDCRKLHREKHKKFKNVPKLIDGKKNPCSCCKKILSPVSFLRGQNNSRDLICRSCTGKKILEEQGKFRCSGCGSVFSKEDRFWNKYCNRCYIKNKEWGKQYQRYYYHNVFKPEYNKVLMLQWVHKLTKNRRINRNGYWHVLNHQLLGIQWKRDFKKWYGFTTQVIEKMRTGKGRDFEDTRHPITKDPEWQRTMQEW